MLRADGDQLRFHQATATTGGSYHPAEEVVRKRVRALFEHCGLVTSEAVAEMSEWEHGGGFSLGVSIRIGPNDRAALERLLGYCARPAFARERLCWNHNGEQVRCQLHELRPDGRTMLRLDPIELLAVWHRSCRRRARIAAGTV